MPTINRNSRLPWEGSPNKKYEERSDNRYRSPMWRQVRREVLQRQPCCMYCLKEGMSVEATVVDHIVPVKQGADFFDQQNLQGLCRSHHQQKSAKEGNAYRRGKQS